MDDFQVVTQIRFLHVVIFHHFLLLLLPPPPPLLDHKLLFPRPQPWNNFSIYPRQIPQALLLFICSRWQHLRRQLDLTHVTIVILADDADVIKAAVVVAGLALTADVAAGTSGDLRGGDAELDAHWEGGKKLSTPAPLQLDSTIHECGDKFS